MPKRNWNTVGQGGANVCWPPAVWLVLALEGGVRVELVDSKGQLLLGEEEELGKMERQQKGGRGRVQGSSIQWENRSLLRSQPRWPFTAKRLGIGDLSLQRRVSMTKQGHDA